MHLAHHAIYTVVSRLLLAGAINTERTRRLSADTYPPIHGPLQVCGALASKTCSHRTDREATPLPQRVAASCGEARHAPCSAKGCQSMSRVLSPRVVSVRACPGRVVAGTRRIRC